MQGLAKTFDVEETRVQTAEPLHTPMLGALTAHRNQLRQTTTRSANIDERFIEPAYVTQPTRDLLLLRHRCQHTEHRTLRVHQDS